MSDIHNTYTNALLADATYALDVNGLEGLTGSNLEAKLSIRMTPILAQYISDNFTVVTHIDSNDLTGTGFDATVWRSNDGKVYVSMTGTEGMQDFLSDVDLALSSGTARAQLAEMINWWLKISTPTTSTVAQITLVSIFDSSVPPQISYEFQSAPPVQGLGLLNGVTNVEVNGHSLGGHLASAFARLFGASANATGNGKVTIDHITTFNSAGFNGKSNFVFQEIEQLIGVGLGRMPTSAEQTNDFAINGLNVTTNTFFSSQIGQRVEVFNEESTGIPNHFMYKLTDALALGDAIAKLDSSFDINKMNHLFDKGANQTEASLEGILDGLRKTLLGSAVAPTPIGDEGDSPNSRNEYHDNLSFLLKSDDFKNLIGKVTLVAPPTSVSEARSDFGAFLSLVYLTPFALKANDIAAGVQLETLNLTNTELALKWEQDNALTPAQITGGAANYSDMWLADRAHLLAQIVHRNTADSILVVGGGSNESYQDFATGHVFWTAEIGFYPGPGLPPDSKHIIFGDDNANINIQGGTKSDHLYGGGGDDLLTGGKGNDYLEGGADSDIYVFLSGDGMDTILDADGQGKITLDGIQLKGQTGVDSKKWLQAGNAWQDQKNHISYSLVTQTDGSQDLLIAAEHNTLVVKNWHSDELGITLGAPQVSIPPPLPTALEPINGDLKPLDIDPVTNGIQTGINALGNIITDPNQPDPGRQDTLYDSTGNDQVNGLSGNDTIKAIRGGDDILDGGDGDDRIEDQAGNDILKGGAGDDTLLDTSGNDILKGGAGKDFLTDTSGNDTLEGGADSDILLDTSGDNLLYADEKKDFQTYYNQSQTATGTGQQGDLLGSGAGTDQLYGSNSQDAMAGGDGADILMGGADDDILYGDGIFTFTTVNPKWSITLTDVRDSDNLLHHAKQLSQVTLQISPQGGDDIIYGGSGNDFIDGGAGNNILVGGTGRDILIGGKDNDIFYAEEQALLDSGLPNATNAYGDFLSGGKGSDTLIGSDKADALMGGEGDDLLMGGDGHDIIFGDADYTTTTYDWTNRAQLQAYAAADETAPGWNSGTALSPVSGSFDTGNGGNDLIYGGGGGDWILAGRGDDIVYGDAGMDSIGGGVGNDVLYGGDDNDSVRGEDGDDWLSGDAGNDFLAGGAGNDTLDGGAGADLMIGGAGDDIYLNVTGDDTINDTEGKNIIQMAMANSVGTGGLTVCTFGDQGQYSQLNITLDNAETLKIQDAFFGTDATIQFANGSQQDLETLVGTTLTTALNLQMGDNGGKLYGGAAADYLYGGSGNDILSGALGDDTLSGGAGNDVLDGGVGDDIYIVKGSGTTHIQDHEGVNSLQIDSAAVAGDYKLFTDSQTDKVFIVKPDGSSIVIEQALFGTELAIKSTDSKLDIVSLREWINANLNTSVNLTVQTDNGNVYGGASSDRLAGLAGNNTLWGGAGEDTLNGNGGNDILYGDAGNDTLLGGEGNDTLSGGTGDDIMEGGLGADTYVFAKTSGHDVIPWQVDAQNDSILFEAGIQRSDLNLIRKINGDLVVAIKGADTDLTLSSWFSGPGQITQFQFADGSKVSQDDLEALKHPQILGTSAADDLKGTDFDDVILGYAGNDTLNGGGGNDILQGGAGRDSYLLQLGGSNVSNGLDTVIETSGEASVIKLINADFGDLVSQRSGDDLTLSILGSDEGLLLNDYYTHTSDWLIVDYSGTEQSLADVLSNNESRRADMDNMALLGEKFAAEWRSRLIKNGTGLTGATQLTDGQFELKPVINFDYHQTQMTDVSGAIINSYEYGTLYNEPWIVTSLNRQTVNNDEAEIYLDDGDAVQYSYSSKLAGVTLANWQQMNTSNTNEQRSYGHYEYRSQLITLPPDLNGFNASGYTVSPTNVPGQYLLTSYKYVAGNLMGYLQDTHIRGWAQVSSMIPGVGAPIEAIDLGHAALNHQSLPQSLTLNIDQFEQTFTLTTLNAGDADNNIHVSSIPGLSYIIHAGGGNDVIDFMEGSFEGRSFLGNSLDIVHPGVLMDGGAGNDTLLTNASFSNDILFGGTGRNYLKGSGGADRYILSTVGGLDLIDPSIQNNVQSVDTVELPDGITRDMLTTAFGQAIVQGQVQSTLNLSWSGKDHTLIVLPGADDWHGVNNFDHVAIKFADGTSVALEELIAVTPITDNIAYYKGNVRVAVATSSCSLTGQGVDNVFVVQGSGITNVKTGDGRNLLQGFNAQSQINAMLTPGSETWLGYGFYFNGGSTVADIKISGASTAQFHIQIGQSDLEHSVLRRDGQDLILQNQSNDLNYPWSRDLHFTDWFTETSQPQVEFGTWFIDQNINNYKYGQFSLHSLIDQFTAQNGGAVSDGSTVAIGSLNWRAAEVPITWGDYSPLGTSDDMTWQLPLTRVMFTAGMGSVIAEKYDVVAFNNSIASTDVYYTKSGNDLLVTLASGTDSLCLQDWYLRSDEPEAWFAKGEVWTYSDLSNQGITLTGTDGNDSLIAVDNYGWNLRGLTGNDVLQGNTGADILEGDEGDDTLTGGAGNDYLDGGAGNDMLSGGAGNDCYHFGLGFGTDSITDQTIIDSGDINTVAIGAGVLPENIIVNSDKNHIILSIAGTTDKLSIQWDTQNGYFVQQVQFDEGTVWTAAMLEAMAIPLNTAPKLVNPILNQNGVENHLFSFQIPAGTFHDTDSGDVLNYTAILADGSPLPTWLNFDAATRNFVGTPGLTDAGTFSLIVTVIDQGGLTANSTFNLNIANFIEGTVYNDSIAGSSGNDFISTGAGNDTVNAGDGNDVIIGGMGSDLLAGGAGDDIFRIEGNDSGYDRFQGDAGIDIILGGAGDDVIRVNNFSGIYTVEKIDGGLGNNILSGTQYNDTIDLTGTELVNIASIDGGVGNDTLIGSAGNDVIIGGSGSDLLAGGSGDDIFRIEGNDSGYDRFQGDAGIDIILGGAGDDVIRVNNYIGIYTVEKIDGGLGNNILSGTQYNDTIDLSGTELVNIASIDGGLGNDTLIGSAGNDVIIGGTGSDLLAGGAGDDIFRIEGNYSGYDCFQGDAGIDLILGGAGDDVIRVNNFSGAYMVEKIDGGLGNNILSGTQYNDTIDLSGTELVNIASIDGGLGNDTLIGSAGNDIIIGGTGSDLLAGGAGDDIFKIEGNDSGYDRFQGDAGIDIILGGAGDDVIRVNNFSGAYTVEKIDGGIGNNILAGTQYNDTIDLSGTELVNIASIEGGAGNDTLIGSAGNDVIIGGTGSDLLAGGAGDDIFQIIGSDSGYDRFQGDAGIDIILGGAGDDVIRVNNFSGAYTVEKIDGGLGNNILAGTQYNDTIDLSGTELVNIASIEGGAGNDKLIGSYSSDTLDGGAGNDTLIGGKGNDTYRFGTGSGADLIQEIDSTVGNTDVLAIATGIDSSQLWFRHIGNDLEMSLIGTGNKTTIKDWYLSTANHIEQFKTTDGDKTLIDSNVQNLVNAMASFAPPAAGQSILPQNYQTVLAPVIAANWQ